MSEFMQGILTFLAGLVSAFLIWGPTQKRIVMEKITQERRKWRDTIRSKSIEVYDAMVAQDIESLHRLKCEFRTLVNPKDDKDIIEAICLKGATGDSKYKRAECFTKKISSLLKQDWERAKLETRPVIFRMICLHKIQDFFIFKAKRQEMVPTQESQDSNPATLCQKIHKCIQHHPCLACFTGILLIAVLICYMIFSGTNASYAVTTGASPSAF